MKRTYFIIVLLLGWTVTSIAQKPSLELTFSAIDSAAHIQLDSIKVMNRTQGGDTVLYFPDTILVLDYIIGIGEANANNQGLKVYQNYPNPVVERTTISVYVPDMGILRYAITDITGRTVLQSEKNLESGVHAFEYSPGGGEISFFTAQWEDSRETIKVLHPNSGKERPTALTYQGYNSTQEPIYKAIRTTSGFPFSLGDNLLYIGYVDGMESGITDAPLESDTIYFQFATNIPCPGTPTVTYEGQVYNTIQIFSQCWMKENLNVGIMIQGSQNATNNGIIEKYCYNNEEDSCLKYGGLYQWDEMMQYTTQQGVQGICPSGWHAPSDEDWKVLEGSVDSQYGVGDPEWDIPEEWRGFDAGTNLRTVSGWYGGFFNGTDLFGFSGMPGGFLNIYGFFLRICDFGHWWTSTKYTDILWMRFLDGYNPQPGIGRFNGFYEGNGYSVRCIKD